MPLGGGKVPVRARSRPAPALPCAVVDGELEVLLAEARRGNRAAFARFVRATNAEVWSFCARVAGRDEADDAAQETYVGLWRSLPSFRGQCSARTWLFQIARRTAWRSRRRRE